MTLHRSIGALTSQQVTDTDRVLTDLWQRIGQQNNIVAQARTAGFDETLITSLTATGRELMARIDVLSTQVDGLSPSQYDEWRRRLQAFGTEVDLYEEQVRTQIGTETSTRNWKIVGSTVGALAVAAVIGAAVWYYGMRRG